MAACHLGHGALDEGRDKRPRLDSDATCGASKVRLRANLSTRRDTLVAPDRQQVSTIRAPTNCLTGPTTTTTTTTTTTEQTDKQQEDLDLPYLSNQQQLQDQLELSGGQRQPSPNCSAGQLASSQQRVDLTASSLGSGSQAAEAAPGAVMSAGQQQVAAQISSPILVTKSASSSSVLSSVSLANGAQMKQQQQQRQVAADADGASTRLAAQLDELAGSGAWPEGGPKESQQVAASEAAAAGDVDQALVGRDPQIQTPKPRIRELKQLLRHTNSLNQLPEFGVETENELELGELIEQIDVWGMNIFEVHKFSQQHSLTAVMYKIFKVSGLKMGLPPAPWDLRSTDH